MRIVLRGALMLCAFSTSAIAQVSITGGVPTVQSFDSLASAGNSSVLPTGWFLSESSGNTEYTADNGSAISGTTYSYGSTSSSERAFGSLRSGSTAPTIGARLQNDTGGALSELLISLTKEQWRVGNTSSVDRLDFQYSLNATTISDGAATWIDVDALDITSIITNGSASALDGNAPANRALVSATLSGLTLAASAQMHIRWVDFNAVGGSGNDDGLAIDDFSVGLAVDNPPQLASSTPEPGDIDVPVASVITLNFSEAVTTSPDPWFTLDCGGAIAATPSGTGASRTITPTANLPFNSLCTLTLNSANIRDTDGVADALTGTGSFTFNTVADTAPTVLSTVPADNATGVAVNANVSINFSEAVDAVGNWITLGCSISGAHSGVISGADASYSFNPDSNLTPGDVCTVTLAAASITDRDGSPQMLAGANVFTFTVAPDVAPMIQGTFPADGAVNVAIAANLTVTFSEPVTVTPAAFAIACGVTQHPYSATTGNQITYTLDPATDFALNTACTLTIVASEINDIDGTPTALASGAVIDFTTSAGVSGYYERVVETSCRQLRATLHGVIDDHVSVAYAPVAGPNNDTWEILEPADQDPANPGLMLDVYENKKFTKVTDRATSVCTGRYNREHTWPKSLGFPSETGDMGLPNAPHTDGHMLYLSNCDYNSHRGNSPYGTCPGCSSVDVTQANYGEGGNGDNNRYTGSVYDVWSKRRGDVARAVLYMDIRYEGGTNSNTGQSEPDLVLTYGSGAGTPGDLDTLLNWHNNDAPANPMSANALDNLEPTRNDVIESFQQNRNPLIDHPEWAPMLFAQPCLGPAVVAVDDDFTMNQDTTLTKGAPGVLRDDHNGVSKNGQGLTATLLTQATSGVATITNGATGAFTYVPTPGFCGNDSFTYEVTNGSVTDQGVAHVAVACTTPDTAPVAVADNLNINEDSGANSLAVLGNDTDVDAGPKFVQSVTQPTGGVVAITNAGANVSFTPNLNFCAATSFSYTLNGGSSTTVNLTMTCFNDAPTTVGSLANQNYTVGQVVNIPTAHAFTDVDNASLTYTATGLPPSLTIDLNTGVISGTLAAGDLGTANVAVTAHDLALASNAQAFTITVTQPSITIFGNGFE